jgi:hypothetical protein
MGSFKGEDSKVVDKFDGINFQFVEIENGDGDGRKGVVRGC